MFVKVFVLGRPGSGKSTAIRWIAELANRRSIANTHLRDYTILLDMCKQDIQQTRFRTIDGGFDVIDFSVLDTVLEQLEEQVRDRARNSLLTERKEIVMIEFARDDYYKALSKFTSEFLNNSYFLFTETGVRTCIERIHKRYSTGFHLSNVDRHSLSDSIMENYYGADKYAPDHDFHNVKIITNSGSMNKFLCEVGNFAQNIFDEEFSEHQKDRIDCEQAELNSLTLARAFSKEADAVKELISV